MSFSHKVQQAVLYYPGQKIETATQAKVQARACSREGNRPISSMAAMATRTKSMGLVPRISSWYSKFNGSHFGLPGSSIFKMTGLGGKMV